MTQSSTKNYIVDNYAFEQDLQKEGGMKPNQTFRSQTRPKNFT